MGVTWRKKEKKKKKMMQLPGNQAKSPIRYRNRLGHRSFLGTPRGRSVGQEWEMIK